MALRRRARAYHACHEKLHKGASAPERVVQHVELAKAMPPTSRRRDFSGLPARRARVVFFLRRGSSLRLDGFQSPREGR